MSDTFKKALAYVQEKLLQGVPKVKIVESFPEFRCDPYTINKVYFFSEVPIIGMQVDLKIDRSFLGLVRKFATLRKLDVEVGASGIFLKKDKEIVGYITDRFFGASDPNLFEELAMDVCLPKGNRGLRLNESNIASFVKLMADSMSGPRFTIFITFLVFISLILAAPFLPAQEVYQRITFVILPTVAVGVTMYFISILLRRSIGS